MGWFSSKKKTYVSSSVISLNPTGNTMGCTRALILNGNQLGVNNLGDFMVESLITGRGNQVKKYYSWANNSGYLDVLGHTSSSIFTAVSIDTGTLFLILEPRLAPSENQTISITNAFISDYSYERYADYWVSQNRPEKMGTNYTVSIVNEYEKQLLYKPSSGSGEDFSPGYYYWAYVYVGYHINIKFSSTDSVDIKDTQWNQNQQFLYVYYNLITTSEPDAEGNVTVTSEPRMYMYQRYSGIPSLDKFFVTELNQADTVFPIIPFRHWDKWVAADSSDEVLRNIYPWAKKAYKRLYGENKYDSMMKQIKESEGSTDADFIYLQPGIAINTDYQAGKKYIRDFFLNIYQNLKLQYKASYSGSLVVKTAGICNFKNTYTWTNLSLTTKRGSIGKKKYTNIFRKDNSYWYEYEGTCYSGESSYTCKKEAKVTLLDTIIQYQVTDTTYEELVISNLKYYNEIYGGKSQSYTAWDELAEIGDDSGFIIPLEKNSIFTVGLVNRTDLSACCFYLVANAYKVQKVKWYQKGIFKVILGAISITLGAFTGGLVGTALITLGSFFLVAGTMQILNKFLVSLFGSFGAMIYTIISTIVKFVLIAVATYFGGPLAGAGAAFFYSMAESWAMGNSLGSAFKTGLIQGAITFATASMGNYMLGASDTDIFTSNAIGVKMLDSVTSALESVTNTLSNLGTNIEEFFTSSGSTITNTDISFIDKLGNNFDLITKVGDVTVSLGSSIYKERMQKKYTNKINELNSYVDAKLKELQNKNNELLGVSAIAWSQMYILGGGALYIPEYPEVSLDRGIMLWTDVIDLQMQEINNITNLNCSTLLPAVSV